MRRRDFVWGCTSTSLAGLTPMRSMARESPSERSDLSNRGLVRPNLSLSTDFGAPAHWGRVVEFARTHSVSRLVYWGGDHKDLYLYPKYPGLLPTEWRSEVEEARQCFKSAAAATTQAGIEFWYVFQVLQLPVVTAVEATWNRPSLAHARLHVPQIFNKFDEPDMASATVYQFICDQLDEVRVLTPELKGIELWVMEGAGVQVSSLDHQQLSTEGICNRVVSAIHNHLAKTGLALDVDLYTAGGDPVVRMGLLHAAQHFPDIIVSGDNVVGDFNAFLPFNQHLVEAAKTNLIAVHFDLNGEYWGRNFIPTSALHQYSMHIEEARKLGASYIDGRVATVHNTWSPHANVLPSRRRFYPGLEKVSDTKPLPSDLNITSTDALAVVEAEFFCRRVSDPLVQPQESVLDSLCREFGPEAKALVPTYLRLEHTLGNLFFADKNYYGFQSVLPDSSNMDLGYLGTQIMLPEGTEFPTPDLRKEISAKRGYKFAFAGWPVPLGHLCSGTSAILFDKKQGLAEAEEIMAQAKNGLRYLALEDRIFLDRLFEDLVYFAKSRCLLMEAQVHYYSLKQGLQGGVPADPARLKKLSEDLRKLAEEWSARYPGGRYLLAERLLPWVKTMVAA